MNEVLLPGLDGSNPLGFLAALGVLRVLSGAAGTPVPRLRWAETAAPIIVLDAALTTDELCRALAADAVNRLARAALAVRFLKVENDKKSDTGKRTKQVGDLTLPHAVLRGVVERCVAAGDFDELATIGGFVSETATDESKDDGSGTWEEHRAAGIPVSEAGRSGRATMPTFFDFTSRNAHFIEQLCLIGEAVSEAGVESELLRGVGPDGARSLDWNPGADRPGALYRASAPPPRPVSEWFAALGLAALPVCGRDGRAQISLCSGRRKAGTFTWPLWSTNTSWATVRSLVGTDPSRLGPDARAARGIFAVYRCDLGKTADGYGGRFSPSSPL